jgi:hypothetical protein
VKHIGTIFNKLAGIVLDDNLEQWELRGDDEIKPHDKCTYWLKWHIHYMKKDREVLYERLRRKGHETFAPK